MHDGFYTISGFGCVCPQAWNFRFTVCSDKNHIKITYEFKLKNIILHITFWKTVIENEMQ